MLATLTTIIVAVIVLGVLIFVHELGHFLVAKRCGVGVKAFSLGFGPFVGVTIGETSYRLSAIPLGGYVRMMGEDPNEEVAPEDLERSFTHKPVGKRLAIVAAGPLFNVLFALVAFYFVIVASGLPQLGTLVGGVKENSPASVAGLQKDDMIIAMDNQKVNLWDEMVDKVQNSQGKPIDITVKRGDQTLTFTLTPQMADSKTIFGEDVKVYQVGIAASPGGVFVQEVSWQQGFGYAWDKTWEASKLIAQSVVKLIDGTLGLDTMGGPVKIAQIAGEAWEHSLASLLALAAMLSVNLAILNLLPIPALDGGHLLFFTVEAISRRKPSLKFRERAQQVGVLLLITLMVVVLYNDITGLFSGRG